MRSEDLIGVWREQNREIISAAGGVTADVPRASQIMYTPDGFMSVVSMPEERESVFETVARMDLNATTPEARSEAANGVTSYAGSYRVVGEEVHHTIFASLNPNRVGNTQIRHVTLSGDNLTLTTPPDTQNNYSRIHWRKVATR